MCKNKVLDFLFEKSQYNFIDYANSLEKNKRNELLDDINLDEIVSIFDSLNERKMDHINTDNISPISTLTITEINKNKNNYFNIGAKCLKNGEVAAVLLAGGQGSRLGNSISKGMVDIGITKCKYILECLIDRLKKNIELTNGKVKLYIMTSNDNHTPLLNFLKENDYFGYDKQLVKLFKQNMLPVLDLNHNLILGNSGVVKAPNGNGGWVKSLYDAGIWNDIIKTGIKWINVFSIDNVLQNIVDPIFIGATISQKCISAGKVVMKSSVEESVGTICKNKGKADVIEYFELPDKLKYEFDNNDTPKYNYGVTLNYLFNVESLAQFIHKNLPLHFTKKRIKYVDISGKLINPNCPNAYKFETLLIDMIRYMDSFLPFEIDRTSEFAPIKNKHGVDSIDTARVLLKKNGVRL